MASKPEKTRYPGIYKRGNVYSFQYRDANGKQRWESARTLEQARTLKQRRETQVADGEHFAASRLTFRAYAEDWIARYKGRGRNDCNENTRAKYRRDLELYAYEQLGGRRLAQLTPRDISAFVSWLCDPTVRNRALSDSRVRNIVAPVRACLATAVEEGLIRHNPAQRVRLPHRPRIEEDEDRIRALSADQLAVLLELIHPRWRTPFRLLAATGLRYSEWIALGPQHLDLNRAQPCVKVRRRLYLGEFAPPKSKYGRRDLPISIALGDEVRHYIAAHPAGEHAGEAILFATDVGRPLDYSNLRKRVLQPAADEADVSWVGFHTFRHTCASLLFARGANAVQVQRWLGHHSAAFTLERYVHLLDGNLGTPLVLPRVSPRSRSAHGSHMAANSA